MEELTKDTVVKVYFKNGTTAEGLVESWTNECGILRALNGENKLIIYSPLENIMMIQVSSDPVLDVEVPEKLLSAPEAVSLVERSRNMARQHMNKIQSDKIAIARALKVGETRDNSSKEGRYELPDFSQHRSVVSSSKKTR